MSGTQAKEDTSKNTAIQLPGEDDELAYKQIREAVQKKQRGRRRLFTFLTILLVVIVVGAFLVPTALNKLLPHSTNYQFAQVTRGTLTVSASATGPIEGAVYNAVFGTTGKVAEIDVQVGQTVTSGQVLAKLDTKLLQDSVDQANVSNVPGQLAIAKDTLAAATLHAPHAGIVTAINGSVGGSSSGTGGPTAGFIQIVDNTALSIQANVSESDIANVVPGQAVQFTVSAYDRIFKGTVSTVVQQGINAANVVTFPVLITVDMSSLQNVTILPGMTASVTIDGAVRQNVLLVSADAINFAKTYTLVTSSQRTDALNKANTLLTNLLASNASLAKDNPSAAYVLVKSNGHWSVVPIVTGLTDGSVYEVLDGLSVGDNVAIGGGVNASQSSNNAPVSGGGGGD